MAPARKLSATDTTGCSWCSTTASCNPLGRVVSLDGGEAARGGAAWASGGGTGTNLGRSGRTGGRPDWRTEGAAPSPPADSLLESRSACPAVRLSDRPHHDHHRVRRVQIPRRHAADVVRGDGEV